MGAGSSQNNEETKAWIDSEISSNLVVVFSKTTCPYCSMAKNALNKAGLRTFTVHELNKRHDTESIMDVLRQMTGARTVPRVFINGKFIGGGSEISALQQNGQLQNMLQQCGAIQ